jgi:hypothetical protein
MITKRTDELRPGDVVIHHQGYRHTIASVAPSSVIGGMYRVAYESEAVSAPHGAIAEAEDEWQVDAPSPLDLAVQRAQELADQYPEGGSFLISGQLKDFSDLLKMFRAAR